MSTRSLIGIENTDKTIDYIYCHYDGYPAYVGKKLTDFYDNEKSIRQLLDLGDLSTLGNNPVANQLAWTDFNSDINGEMCRAYRTRGEEDVDFKTSRSLDAYVDSGRNAGIDYIYLYKPIENKWLYITVDESNVWDDVELKL